MSEIDLVGSQEAFEKFLPQAMALDERDVIAFRADAALALHNVQDGVRAVLAREEDIKRLPVKIPQLRELPSLAQAVLFAAMRVNRDQKVESEIAKLWPRVPRLRRRLLHSAVTLADAGIVPEAEVEAIKKGHGKLDAVNDCVALAALHRGVEKAIRGKTTITTEEIDEAAEVGSRLQTLIKPGRAHRNRQTPEEVEQAADIRDRMWTLLVERHDLLWRVGAWLFGREVDEHVPPLQSREGGGRAGGGKDDGGKNDGGDGADDGGPAGDDGPA